MKLKRYAAFLFAIVFCFQLYGCTDLVSKFYPLNTEEESTYHFTPVTSENGEAVFTDFDGNVISLPDIPERIVSVSSVSTEIICGLGAGRYLVGIDSDSANLEGAPINASVLPYYYMSYSDIVALRPDIVFYSSEYISNLTLEALKNSGVMTVRIPGTGNIAAAEANIRFISALLQRETTGDKMIDEMRLEFAKIKRSAALVGVRKKIYIEYLTEFRTCGKDTILSEICEMAGYDNVYSDKSGFVTVNAASLLEKDPEAILIVALSKANENTIRDRKSIEKVNAVKENKIYAYNIGASLRPTQSIVEAAAEIAKLLGTTN